MPSSRDTEQETGHSTAHVDSRLVAATCRIMQRAAQAAGESLTHDFGEVEKLQVSRKGPRDFASKADHRAEEIVSSILAQSYPDFGIIGEESGIIQQARDNATWIIDPLDGTLNFLHGVPHFCVSIGLELEGRMVAGVTYDPIRHEMFCGQYGQGTTMNNHRLRVSSRQVVADSVVACSLSAALSHNRDPAEVSHGFRKIYDQTPSIRRTGSAALDMAYVAAGRFDGFWSLGMQAWDVAAGIVLIRESGGQVNLGASDAFSVHSIGSESLLTAGNTAMAKILRNLTLP